jgi:hypothetical protein
MTIYINMLDSPFNIRFIMRHWLVAAGYDGTLATLLEFLRPGDALVVTRIDRLARSMHDLQIIVASLKASA